MGFFSKLFGSKPSQLPEETLELSLDDLPNFLDREISSSQKDFEKSIQLKLAEVKHLVNEFKKQLQALKTIEPKEGANDRLLKVFYTSKKKMLSKMDFLLEKLSVPDTTDLLELKKYCFDANLALKKDIFSSGKDIAYTGFLLREQMKFLGKTINELNSVFEDLNKSFSSSSAMLTDFNSQLTDLTEKNFEKNSLKEKLSSLQKQLSTAKQDLSKSDLSLQELNSSKEAKTFHSVEEELIKCNADLHELKNKILAVFSNTERPFKKLKNFCEKNPGTLTKKQFSMLEYYLNDPFLALKTDLQAKKLSFLLNRLKTLINSNEIEFNEKEKEKTLATVTSLQGFDFLNEFFWKENSLKKKLFELEEKKKAFNISEKIARKEQEKNSLQLKINNLNDSIKKEKSFIKKLEEEIFYEKDSLEKKIKDATNKTVLIKIE